MFVKNWSSQLDPALIYLPLSTAILRWTSVLAPQLPVGPNNRLAPFGEHPTSWRQKATSDKRPNLFDSYTQLCEQMYVLLQELENKSDGPSVNRAGFGFQGGNNPFFPRGRNGKPAFGGSNRFSSASTVPKFMQPAAGRADTKAIAPQTPASVQLSLTSAPGTSWLLRTWPDWTKRGRELWEKIWGGEYFWF